MKNFQLKKCVLIFLIITFIFIIPVSAENTVSLTATPGTTWSNYKTVTCTGTATGANVTSWTLDYGEGDPDTGTGTTPISGTHQYSTTGEKTVQLTVEFDDDDSKSTTQNPTIEEPATLVASADVTTTEGSLTVDYESTTVGAVSWAWTFGDDPEGTASNDGGSYTYDDYGSYDIILVATSAGGKTGSVTKPITLVNTTATATATATATTATATATATATTSLAPNAYFTVDYDTGGTPHYVKFTDGSTKNSNSGSSIKSWRWDLDDDGSYDDYVAYASDDDDPDTEYVYTKEGNYTVSLKVRDEDDYEDTYEMNIVVDNDLAPEADFDIDGSDTGYVPFTVKFKDKSDNIDNDDDDSIDEYYWYFYDDDNDDIETKTSRSTTGPEITFEEAGVYTVRLTVVEDGITDTKVETDYITVKSSATATATKTATPTQTATAAFTYATETTATETSDANIAATVSSGTTIFGIPGTEYFRSEMGRFYNFYKEYSSIIAGFFGMS